MRGEIAVSSSLVKTVLDYAAVTSRIFKNIFGLEVYLLLRSRAAESSYILEGKAGQGIYILEDILEYGSARDPLYSQRYVHMHMRAVRYNKHMHMHMHMHMHNAHARCTCTCRKQK